ncbi:hypothetical protein NX794_01450 [Streptomyces sp. LP11]|uniref:Integral membrane protein n=1 Tax=Streptomyces pyxinicus TaxID=2970331 RepID=A0ABT2AUI8_9ACTN|nr:hypothetical protein [Streptomyces sp. LP11]MCS0599912.1 hypothetical protein [Streptomyces sp. LP11]
MPVQPDRTPPSPGTGPGRGVAATTFAVLRRHRAGLASATVRVVGRAGLSGLLMTSAIFALAWPVFTHMRNQRIHYQQLEDPYLHDHTTLGLVALCTLPLYLLLLGTGTAALQRVCSQAVAAETQNPPREGRSPVTHPARLRPILAVYALRGLIVWPLPLLALATAHALTGDQLDTPQPLERGSWPYTLVAASPVAAVLAALVLRLAFALAPAAAATGLGPRAALRRSWSLTWTRAGAARILATTLPLAALTAGALRLATQLALPLRPLTRALLEQATGNFFAAYYAGILTPVIVAILVTAAVTLPLSCTAFAALHDRLCPPRTPRNCRQWTQNSLPAGS